MAKKLVWALPLVLILAGAFACHLGPQEKTVNLLVHQDRWGEVAPCG